MTDYTGNMPSLPAIFPDQPAPVVRQGDAGRELAMMRWGMASQSFALKNRKTDPGVTNVRNLGSSHWRRWLGVEHRCLVPFTSSSEYRDETDKSRTPVWFAKDEDRPLMFFAGIWTEWTNVRKVKEGEMTAKLYGFLTTEANATVGAIHPKAMPVILTEPDGWEAWLTAPFDEAKALQRPLPDDVLRIVADGERRDGDDDR